MPRRLFTIVKLLCSPRATRGTKQKSTDYVGALLLSSEILAKADFDQVAFSIDVGQELVLGKRGGQRASQKNSGRFQNTLADFSCKETGRHKLIGKAINVFQPEHIFLAITKTNPARCNDLSFGQRIQGFGRNPQSFDGRHSAEDLLVCKSAPRFLTHGRSTP
jgi:hypothetical protein